ncbi:THUMP-like domain-containing protein [Plantactinospora sp. WMMB334]|uniref:THUMP-like domain-containing protein n=1 Tax=Plantactinospora sp. WMMB334 TaxID=3404119 RepID=UPI003B93C438
MDLDQLAALRTPEGGTALATAADLAGGDPLVAAAALRSAGISGGLAAAALTQAELRRRAAAKFGPDAARMFFTRAGLEQATRPGVAARRAARLRAAGVRTLVDLGCGLGADAIAAARAGIRVYGVEADPLTAAMAAANAGAAGVADRFTVEPGDATRFDVTAVDGRPVDAVFCDPARRRPGTGRRVFDPAAYSPSWDFLLDLAGRIPRTVFKVAPGIDHALLPPGAEGEWVSVGGDLVEATVWSAPLAGTPRRATLLTGPAAHGAHVRTGARPGEPDGPTRHGPTDPAVHELTGDGTRQAPVGPVRRYLYDPDPAVVRAHLVAEFADTVDGTLADPEIAYVYADAAAPTPYARCLEVVESLPFSLKRLRARLRELGVGRAEILKRGSALEPERLRRDLRLTGTEPISLVLTRVAGAPTALLCHPPQDGL